MAIKLATGFEILRFSDLNYEKMTVEIQYSGEQFCQINMDQGLEQLEIELLQTPGQSRTKVPLQALLEAFDAAKRLLCEYEGLASVDGVSDRSSS